MKITVVIIDQPPKHYPNIAHIHFEEGLAPMAISCVMADNPILIFKAPVGHTVDRYTKTLWLSPEPGA